MSSEQETLSLHSDTPFVTVSDTAYDQIQAVITQQNRDDLFLRLFVQSTAAGVSFGMALDTRKSDDDHTCKFKDLDVAIDRISFPYLENGSVDFVQEDGKSGFQVTSPNQHLLATAAGGCGSCSGDAGCCG